MSTPKLSDSSADVDVASATLPSPGSPANALRVFSSEGAFIVPDSVKLEEEQYPWYTLESFYPVHIVEVFCSRYQVLYKIGHGTTSTVWICRDLNRDEYVCMKSMVQDYPSFERELKAYEYLSKEVSNDTLLRKKYVRQQLDHFELRHGDYNYHFLIHEPLGHSIRSIVRMCGGTYPTAFLPTLALQLLRALEFIHSANVVHGDISPYNILFSIHDRGALGELEEKELREPSPRKLVGDRMIYANQEIPRSTDKWFGRDSVSVLCDFGEARSGEEWYKKLAQQPEYRAPEVFLRIAWRQPVDIWNFGCLMWYFATGQDLFPDADDSDENPEQADGIQLATMSMLLGRPPRERLETSGEFSLKFFNEDGSSKYNVPNETLESCFASAFEGHEKPPSTDQSQAFIAFIRRVLIWDGRVRPTASQLLMDPWIDECRKRVGSNKK